MLKSFTENKAMMFKGRKKVVDWIHAKCNINYVDLSNWIRDFDDGDPLLRYIVFDRFANIACTIMPIDCITCSSPHDALEILDKFPWAFDWLETYLDNNGLLYDVFEQYLDYRNSSHECIYKKLVTKYIYGLFPKKCKCDRIHGLYRSSAKI